MEARMIDPRTREGRKALGFKAEQEAAGFLRKDDRITTKLLNS